MPARPPRLGALASPWHQARPARWARWSRWARLAALAPALALAAACSGDDDDDDTTGPDGGINGAYALTQINGQTFSSDRVQGGLELDDGDYGLALRVDNQTAEDAGTYERSGSRIDFTSNDGSQFSGTLSNSNRVVTIVDEDNDLTLRFER